MPLPPVAENTLRLITIGQSPRDDIVSEMVDYWTPCPTIVQVGALDNLSIEALRQMAPSGSEPQLVSRLRDGSEIILGKRKTTRRLQDLLNGPASCTASALMCTGRFDSLRPSGLFFDAHALVDDLVESMARGLSRIGIVVPLAEQVNELRQASRFWRGDEGIQITPAINSPYRGEEFDRVGRELSECELIVMHCMGYTRRQKSQMVALTGRPVILAREVLASATALVVSQPRCRAT